MSAQAATMSGFFAALVVRDLRLARRRQVEALLPLSFFLVTLLLFPLGLGPEPRLLQEIAPGAVWICALLAAMLSLGSLYAADQADGSLEQLLLAGQPLLLLALAKAAVHWIVSGLPLIVAAPLAGLLFGMQADALAALGVSLLLGTPILSLIGSVGAALTLGLRGGGMLVVLIVLPLAVPVLVFGSAAVTAVDHGLSPAAHHSLLGALLIFALLLAPPAAASALRIAME
jgi:heme exporter protein B